MTTFDRLVDILRNTLMVGDNCGRFASDTKLLGSMPGFDSMAVVSLLTALEEQFGITVEDDEMSADIFETLGTLQRFVESKLT